MGLPTAPIEVLFGAYESALRKSDVTAFFHPVQASMAFEVNSVPRSETIGRGRPRRATMASSSRAIRLPEIRPVGDGCKAFLGDAIDHVEDAQPSTAGELVMDEVNRPARVWQFGEKQRDP
jgi:hypothetical protein